ncbi:hypothetical protein H6G33_17810 [Calothrix sp. FACHB-1219]|uniref:hypothetical protein n=1 Tax=unclassified Calothrix TaxID=2619626 RepID=UPI001685A48F|nr:hypothetical protein [Calothrix sp. FACHB-168]MBD2202735.1 hypothetical protein [Calothrix sp. FACHB-168]MBD2218888.1 hypothetical protein [Calothrix sp. FACHB-1219]
MSQPNSLAKRDRALRSRRGLSPNQIARYQQQLRAFTENQAFRLSNFHKLGYCQISCILPMSPQVAACGIALRVKKAVRAYG